MKASLLRVFTLTALLLFEGASGSASAAIDAPIRGWVTKYADGISAVEQYKYKAAEQFLISALDSAEGDDRKTVCTLEALERLYSELANYDAEEHVMLQQLHLFEEANFPLEDQARVCVNLGTLDCDRGRYENAQTWFSKALPLLQKCYGDLSAEVAVVLNDLGWVAQQRGQLPRAEQFFKKSLYVLERIGGQSSIMYGLAAGNLAEVYIGQSRTAEALLWLGRSCEALGQARGKNDPVTRAVKNRYQTVHKKLHHQGRRSEIHVQPGTAP